jgi:hypothetical protein
MIWKNSPSEKEVRQKRYFKGTGSRDEYLFEGTKNKIRSV